MSSFFLPRFRSRRSSSNSNSATSSSSTESALAIETCKQIGDRHGEEGDSRPFDEERLSQDLKLLISLMGRHRKDKHVQRVAAHTISNMAIQQEKCAVICRHNGHRSILRAVSANLGDWKMCWLGMSAV